MPLDTPYANDVLLLGDAVVWGTCMLGDDLGTVVSCRLKRSGTPKEIVDQHEILVALLMLNPRLELELETVFELGVPVPGLMDEIEFPFLQIAGRVMDAEIAWERGTERALTIRASQWDALRNATLNKIFPSTLSYRGGPEGAFLQLNDNSQLTNNANTSFRLNVAA